jgi:hypothetical protein
MKAMILEDKELLTFKEVKEPKPFGEKAYRLNHLLATLHCLKKALVSFRIWLTIEFGIIRLFLSFQIRLN